MATITQILSIAQSGLTVSQAQAALVARNLANASTPGYAHEILPAYPQIGANGVTSGDPIAMRSFIVERSLAAATGRSNYYQSQLGHLAAAEAATSELDGVGLGKSFADFQSALSLASANPGGAIERQQVLAAAAALGDSFSVAHTQLDQAASGAKGQAEVVATHVNQLSSQIAGLNARIRAARPGEELNGLMTMRADLVHQLSAFVGVNVLQRPDGTIQLSTSGGRTIVEDAHAATLAVMAGGPPPRLIVSFVKEDGTRLPATGSLGGQLGGIVDSYDSVLAPAKTRLDEMAFSFMSTFNDAHKAGFDLDGNAGGDFFELPADADGASAAVRLSANITGHPERIAAAADASLVPGDNQNLTALIGLVGDAPVLADGSSLRAAWSAVGDNVSNSLVQARAGVDLEQGSLDQLTNLLASEEGVNADEEFAKLSQATTALEAATRVIQVVQTMNDTVIAMMG